MWSWLLSEQSTESGETAEKKSQARIVITYEELKELIKKQEILVIDVREPKEVEQTGMMPGAINIPRQFMMLLIGSLVVSE